MNFYVDSGGVVLHVAPERIFQGSANANTIRFIGAFAPNLPVLVAFKLPNGVWTTPQSMGFSAQLSGVETNDGVQFNTWEYQIPQVITENYGTVNVQFYVYGDAGGTGGQIASAMSSFVVEKGVPITLPDPTDDYQTLLTQILAVLSQIQSEIGDLPNNYVPRSSGRHIVYVNDINGNPSTQIYAVDASGNIIVQRDGNGQIRVPLAPLQGYDATSKNYVDESIEALPSKYVTLDTNQTISGNKTHTGINTFNGFTSINGVGIDADAIVKGSDRFKYPVKSGTLALTSDIPENIVTTDTDQTIDGTKGFTSPITVGGQTWRTSYMKDSFVYTVDGYSYEVTYPEKSGLMALKSDIPTDYATQGQLAQTNQNVEDLYTILEQAQVVTVTTLEQAYTTRETADGENIVDGVQTTVKEIRGKTVATENLIPYPYAETTKTANGVTFTVNSDGSVTVNGTATSDADFMLLRGPIQSYSESYFLSGCPTGGSDTTYYISEGFTMSKDTGNGVVLNNLPSDQAWRIVIKSGTTVNNLVFRPMLNAGTEAKPYSKWFAGLKNASFEKIVSTGKNLVPYPYAETTKTANGVTFTVNADESVTVNGTATATTNFYFVKGGNDFLTFPIGTTLVLSGCPAGGSARTYFMNVLSTDYLDGVTDIGNGGASFTTKKIKYYLYIRVEQGVTMNNAVFRPMLQFGTTATAYEPYISDTLSAENPIELSEYDVVYPETGETKRQSKTVVFDGTEAWVINTNYTAFSLDLSSKGIAFTSICSPYRSPKITAWDQLKDYEAQNGALVFLIKDSTYSTVEAWKAHLAELAAAGNPLTVTYKTVEATTEATPFNKSKYKAWKNGSETIDQGPTDNSEYGAENTVKQDYFTLTGGTTNV